MSKANVLTRNKRRQADAAFRARHLPEARDLYQRICQADPRDHEAWLMLGTVQAMLGAQTEAEAALRRALTVRPDLPQAQFNLARLLELAGRPAEAVPVWQALLRLQPRQVDHHHALGEVLQRLGRLEEAATAYREAVRLDPGRAESHNNLGVVLQDLGQYAVAETSLRTALRLNPALTAAHANLGNLYQQQGKFEQALSCYRQALALDPSSAATHVSVGFLHKERGEFERALEHFDTAIALQPGYAGAHWNRALVLLLLGRLREGWADYEWRFQCPEVVQQIGRRTFGRPRWDGADLEGRTLLVHAEQGLGDAIQFVRYLPAVAARGGRVILESPPELVTLLQGLAGVAGVVGRIEGRLPSLAFDLHLPLMSLPGVFETALHTIPNAVPYLNADPQRIERWRPRLAGEGFKVGLVWAGNPRHWNDRNRSCTLADFAPLAAIPGLRFFSLQKGPTAAQAVNPPAGLSLIDLAPELHDFADTAAVIAQLDLVLAVDTSVLHLAGALGRPAWALLPALPDWRWLLGRDDSPWYPTLRLFRQTEPGDWVGVFARVATALRAALC